MCQVIFIITTFLHVVLGQRKAAIKFVVAQEFEEDFRKAKNALKDEGLTSTKDSTNLVMMQWMDHHVRLQCCTKH